MMGKNEIKQNEFKRENYEIRHRKVYVKHVSVRKFR